MYFVAAGALALIAIMWSGIARRAITLYNKRGNVVVWVGTLPSKSLTLLDTALPRILRGLDLALQRAWAGLQKLGEWIVKGAEWVWPRFEAKPYLWLGVMSLLWLVYGLYSAYANADWKTFHEAGLPLTFAIILLLAHFDKHRIVCQAIWDNLKISWVAISSIVLVTVLSHGWWKGAMIAGLSLTCSIVTIGGWWGKVGEGLSKLSSLLLSFFSGDKGAVLAVISWSIVGITTVLFYHGKGVEYLAELEASSGITLLVIFFGIAYLAVSAEGKIKK
jgi:hypothetical protein